MISGMSSSITGLIDGDRVIGLEVLALVGLDVVGDSLSPCF